jgi:hypothetical protein
MALSMTVILRGLAKRGLEGRKAFTQPTRFQYGSRTKMNVVPVTIGALAPTNETLASLT